MICVVGTDRMPCVQGDPWADHTNARPRFPFRPRVLILGEDR